MTTTHIRNSTDADIRIIHAWLLEEQSADVQGNFLCNWEITRKLHDEGKLLVYVDPTRGEAVAYQWGALIRPGILQVKSDRRGRGIGRAMVEHCVAQARERYTTLLHIECTPLSSIPFWRKMGFTVRENHEGKSEGYRVLPVSFELPKDGKIVQIVVRFYQEDAKWKSTELPVLEARLSAKQTTDGLIHLPERIQLHEGLYGIERAAVVEIQVDGTLLYRDKARYPDAINLGVQTVANGFVLDTIEPDALNEA